MVRSVTEAQVAAALTTQVRRPGQLLSSDGGAPAHHRPHIPPHHDLENHMSAFLTAPQSTRSGGEGGSNGGK
jgi:hypothetical protein